MAPKRKGRKSKPSKISQEEEQPLEVAADGEGDGDADEGHSKKVKLDSDEEPCKSDIESDHENNGNGKDAKAEAAEVEKETPVDEDEDASAASGDSAHGDNGNVPEEPKKDDAKTPVADNGNHAKADAKVEPDKAAQSKPKISGTLLLCGGTNWDLTGRKELPKAAKNQPLSNGKNLWGPHAWREKVSVKAVISSSTACHSVLVTDEGKAMTWGRNDKGQLGLGDCVTRNQPTIVEALKVHKVVSAACGKGHTLFLTDKGMVFSCGDNKMGQLGIGSQSQSVMTPTKISYSGKPVVRVACGSEFSMIVDAFGGLYSFGSPEYGQLGHNSEGKYFTAGNKISYHCETSPRRIVVFIEKTREGHILPIEDVSVAEVACGVNHALCTDSKKRCFSWGFAGYGRLGHSETKNELMPRMIKIFDYVNRGAKKVWAGGTFSMALDENGMLYFWGQNKSSGEATMYPKHVQDLCGWNIRTVSCANKSIVVAADESLISWGASPTYGELGYGENKAKSSTTPQEVKPLEGIHIKAVSCGYGHTLMIARDDTQAERDLIDKLPKWP